MKKIIYISLTIIIIILIGIYLIQENNTLEISNFEIKNELIPEEFNQFKIIQISDFHNTKSKKLTNSIIKNIKRENPDIILITGDLIDSRRTDIKTAINFVKEIKDIANIYYVPGNHESRIDDYQLLINELQNLEINILSNKIITLNKNNTSIDIIGINDPTFFDNNTEQSIQLFKEELSRLREKSTNYNILLSHRPELFDLYVQNNFDLVFTGHAHGGQIALPYFGGIFVPSQGFFPKYTEGLHQEKNTNMIISRGIGNSLFPFRINNNPELIIVTLKSK